MNYSDVPETIIRIIYTAAQTYLWHSYRKFVIIKQLCAYKVEIFIFALYCGINLPTYYAEKVYVNAEYACTESKVSLSGTFT